MAINTRSENEVDDLINSLESKGVKIIKKPEKVYWGGCTSYVADPYNNFWGISFNPFLPIDINGKV